MSLRPLRSGPPVPEQENSDTTASPMATALTMVPVFNASPFALRAFNALRAFVPPARE